MNVKRLNLTPPYRLKILEQVTIYLNLIIENNWKQVNQHYNFKQISSCQAGTLSWNEPKTNHVFTIQIFHKESL